MSRAATKAVRSVNQILRDRALSHAMLLERYKRAEVRDILGFLRRDVFPDLVKRLEFRLSNPLAGAWSTNQLRDLTATTHEIMRAGMAQINSRVETQMKAFAVSEAEWQSAVLRAAIPFDISMKMPSIPLLHAIVTDRPFEGRLMKSWFDDIAAGAQKAITKEIRIGLATGEGVEKIVSRLKGSDPDIFSSAFNGSTLSRVNANASAVVRTAIAHTTNDARQEVYQENTDIIKGEQMVATLDGNTTLFCINIDGKVYAVGVGPRPPFHWGCRTVAVPLTKSWKELGIDRKETTAKTRASMNGEVPANQTYPEWLREQSKEFQESVLGKERAALWRSNQVTIDRFIGSDGDPLTLDELRRREGLTGKN